MADVPAADPREVAEQGLRLSGMEYIQAIFRGELPAPPISELMGFRGVEAEPGRAVFEMEPGPQHYNPIGSSSKTARPGSASTPRKPISSLIGGAGSSPRKIAWMYSMPESRRPCSATSRGSAAGTSAMA